MHLESLRKSERDQHAFSLIDLPVLYA
jgi:hypothetical protein